MEKNKYPEGHFIAQGMAIGIAIGTGLGIPIGVSVGNPGLFGMGLPIGVAIGYTIGNSWEKKAREEGRVI